ncbi:MAG: hypothetical protein AAF984_06050 [Verrucomicrobiota bacterium]
MAKINFDGSLEGVTQTDLLRMLEEDVSEEARVKIFTALLQSMNLINEDAREEGIPLGMVLFIDSEGHSVLMNANILIKHLQDLLTDELKTRMQLAL